MARLGPQRHPRCFLLWEPESETHMELSALGTLDKCSVWFQFHVETVLVP